MKELTHEEVSELLGPYSSGELELSLRTRIDSHLAICEGCTRELAGMTALRAIEIEPMTGPERERMTAAVRAAVLPIARPRWSERFGRRLAPALGAAALVVVAIIGYVSFQDGGSSPTEVSADSQGAVDEEARTGETTRDDDIGGGSGGIGQKSKKGATSAGSAASAETLEIEADVQGNIAGNDAPTIPVATERRFARTSFTPDLFAPRDARKRTLSFDVATAMTYAAEDPTVATLMEECARTAIETSPHLALTPTYAAHFPADDIIVIGFVWRGEGSNALNFELRGWRGDSCDRVSPIYRSGPV